MTVVIAIVVLACQAVIPLQVESILSKGVWSTGQFALLTGLVFAVIVGLYGTELGAKYVATQSAERLRQGIFAQALRVRVIRRDGLVRSSIVSRHTSDVDNVSEAFSTTVSAGLCQYTRRGYKCLDQRHCRFCYRDTLVECRRRRIRTDGESYARYGA